MALAATAATAQGQDAVRRLTLKQCMDRALAANYDVQAANKSIERARTMQGTAWDIDKTDVTLGQGPEVPVVMPSRGDDAQSKYYSLALAALQSVNNQ